MYFNLVLCLFADFQKVYHFPTKAVFLSFWKTGEEMFALKLFICVLIYLHGSDPCSMNICILNTLLLFHTYQANRLGKLIFFFFISYVVSRCLCEDITLGVAGEEMNMAFNFNEMDDMKQCGVTAIIKP